MRQQIDSKISLLKPEKKREVVEAIIAYFKREREEEIGVIAAEDMLDFVLDLVGKEIFNKGVDETSKLIQERLAGVWVDAEATVKK